MLYLIKQDVVHLLVCHVIVYIIEQHIWVTKFFVSTILQVHFYDMIFCYTNFFQMLTEEIEK